LHEADNVSEQDVLLDDLESDGIKKTRLFDVTDDIDVDIAVQLVRKIVPLGDDPTLPTLTIRVFVLGLTFCIIGAAVSQLLYFKSNAPSFSSFFVVLVSLPLGNLMAKWLPDKMIYLGPLHFSLNPGPFVRMKVCNCLHSLM
jgi:hypothetical protein